MHSIQLVDPANDEPTIQGNSREIARFTGPCVPCPVSWDYAGTSA